MLLKPANLSEKKNTPQGLLSWWLIRWLMIVLEECLFVLWFTKLTAHLPNPPWACMLINYGYLWLQLRWLLHLAPLTGTASSTRCGTVYCWEYKGFKSDVLLLRFISWSLVNIFVWFTHLSPLKSLGIPNITWCHFWPDESICLPWVTCPISLTWDENTHPKTANSGKSCQKY